MPTRGPQERLTAGRFFGHRRGLVEVAGLVLSDVRYEPGQRVPPHGHELGYFCLLVEGGYWEQYGRRRVECSPRSIVFHPPGDQHHGGIGPAGGHCFNVELRPSLVARLSDVATPPATPVHFRGGELVWLAARLYREFRDVGRGGDGGSALAVEGLALELLGGLARERSAPGPRSPRWLRAACDRLHDELDRALTVDGIAADLGVSPVRLSRAFRRHYGETLGDRLRRLRVERACELLADPDARLSAIALEVGFADQSHFTRVFKRHTGLTPGQYRRLASA